MAYNCSFYNKDTGEIMSAFQTGTLEDFEANTGGRTFVTGIHSGLDYYVKDGEVTERPVMNILQQDNTLTGLPKPCEVVISNSETVSNRQFYIDNALEEYTISDGEFEYECSYPCELKITVRAFPYKDWEGVMTFEGDV